MKHSIIIPHRDRLPYLMQCLESVWYSRDASQSGPVDIVIVGGDQHATFNKSKALNDGIARAQGDTLTFLDCDAIVGPQFLRAAIECDWSAVHRLCYRVRYFTADESEFILSQDVEHVRAYLTAARHDYDGYRLAYEAYGDPCRDAPSPHEQPWGNSQFTIRRDTLGDLRFDESYVGRGFEDVDFMRRLREKIGPGFKGKIETHPDRAMFHLVHPYEANWKNEALTAANLERFKKAHTRAPQ